MNNQRFRPGIWRLRLQLRFSRLRARWHAFADAWRVPRVITNRWFVLGAYFLVVLLVGLAWFGRPAVRFGGKLPGENPGYPISFFFNPNDDIAPPFNQPPVDPVSPPAVSGGEVGTKPAAGDASVGPTGNPADTSTDEPASVPATNQPGATGPDRANPVPLPDQPQNDAMAAGGNPPALAYPIAGDISITNPFALAARQGTLGDWRSHQAVDIAAAVGTAVRAAAAGTVKQILQNDLLWGTVLVLDHGSDYTTSYSNLQDLTVRTGQSVTVGQVIGKLAGSPPVEQMEMAHLHFALYHCEQAVDPIDLFR